MAQPGYPDWGTYSVPSADNVFSDHPPVAGNYDGTPTDCSAWSSILLSLDNPDPNTGIFANIAWSGYNATVENLVADTFIVGPNQFASFTVPTKGRLVSLHYSTYGPAPTFSPRYGIAGLSHPMSKYDAKSDSGFIFNDKRAYGAGGTLTLLQNYWYEGPVSVCAFATGAAGGSVAFLKYDNSLPGFVAFAAVGITTIANTVPEVVYFPPAPVEMFVQNPGAAQTIEVHVLPVATM